MTRTVVARVKEVLPSLTDRVLGIMLSDIPFYASGAVGEEGEIRERLSNNIGAAVEALNHRRHDPTQAMATGRLRAQQEAPLADVLSAYRLAFGEIWNEAVRVSRTTPTIPAEALVDLSSAIFRLHNMESEALTHAFHAETQHILLTRERERTAMVDVLFSDDVGPGTLLEAARSLGLPMDGSFLVVAGESELGRDPMPRIEPALVLIGVPSVWRLHREISVGLLNLPGPGSSEAAVRIVGENASAAVGVSPVFGTLSRAPWGLNLARVALRQASGSPAVQQFQLNPLNLLVAASPGAAMEAARSVLGGILRLGADRRELLLETLDVWVEAGGSAGRAADILYCHPNTIRKRLKRIEKVTERSLTHPSDVAELVAAGRAWRHFREP
ncbi:helix-turn-helix domain-containing protein [Nesterenkonia sp. CL21]|uniref:PucR family transcriptional regulator n=1 Tax=Nesterenkonia sp. CL21 TaxID=3064894 RepID=UPI00287A1A53|nr:helix-turn-helix domain-containing protein [Nesterenkonia sp. CL21]MDS2174111.1 helix-turn-helix domain-containing protein [Nesterenkonia sp. CL21]